MALQRKPVIRRGIPLMRLALASILALTPIAAMAAGKVDVSIKEWSIHFQNTDVKPGKINFVVHNKGQYTHAFEIDRNGTKIVRSGNIRSGRSKTVTAELKDGHYDVYCPIDDHKRLGIDARIDVTAQGIHVIRQK